MFKTRLISGAVLVAAALFTGMVGGLVLFFTCLALSEIAAGELFAAADVRPKDKPFGYLDVSGYIGIAILYICILFLPESAHTIGIIIPVLLIMFVYVFTFPKYDAHQVFAAAFAIIYTGFMLSCLYQTRMLENGVFHYWLIFISAWGSDTGAYCVGMLFGKHKMTPVLSPKKTIEGAVGGVAIAVLLGLIYALATHGPVAVYMVICFFGAIISMVGDLAASAIKRNMDIKDYGNLIPGHGGILDRFDSIIFTAPIIFYLSSVLIS